MRWAGGECPVRSRSSDLAFILVSLVSLINQPPERGNGADYADDQPDSCSDHVSHCCGLPALVHFASFLNPSRSQVARLSSIVGIRLVSASNTSGSVTPLLPPRLPACASS